MLRCFTLAACAALASSQQDCAGNTSLMHRAVCLRVPLLLWLEKEVGRAGAGGKESFEMKSRDLATLTLSPLFTATVAGNIVVAGKDLVSRPHRHCVFWHCVFCGVSDQND